MMNLARAGLLLFALVGGCHAAALHVGTDAAATDLAGSDLSGRDLQAAPVDFAGEDLSGISCISQQCPAGGSVKCAGGTVSGCCTQGEWCDNGTCRCGMGVACTGAKTCETGGPGPVSGSGCGSICCGGPGSPCPL